MSENEEIIVSADDTEIYESLRKINLKKEEFMNNTFKKIEEYNKYLDKNEDSNPLTFEQWQKNNKKED